VKPPEKIASCRTPVIKPFSEGEDFDSIDASCSVPTPCPVIGVMCQLKTGPDWVSYEVAPDGTMTEFLAASYVKYVESAGGRVVPISSMSTKGELTEMFGKLNGLLVPGEASIF
jgi:hypothetical protein